MVKQTSFDLEDAKNLLSQLTQFYRTLWQEWSHVSTQWNNLKETWRDEQFNQFEPLFEQLSSTYKDEIEECESYIVFLKQQIEIADKRRVKLGDIVTKVVTIGQIGQQVFSLAPGFSSNEVSTSQAQPVCPIEQQQGSQKSEPITGPTKAEKKLTKAWNTSQKAEQKRRKEEAEKAANSFNQSKASGSGKPPKKPL